MTTATKRKAPAFDPTDLEAAHLRVGLALLRRLGYTTYTLSQARASRQTPGLPDVWAMRGGRRPAALWWEVKGRTGHPVSPAQRRFAQLAAEAGVTVVIGTADDLTAHLLGGA